MGQRAQHLRDRDNPARVILADTETGADYFKEVLQLAEEQVILVAQVEKKVGRPTDARSSTSCTVTALIGFSWINSTKALPSRWSVRRMRSSGLRRCVSSFSCSACSGDLAHRPRLLFHAFGLGVV